MTSGHQRSERRSGVKTEFVENRAKKLVEQRAAATSTALADVRVYVNGYLKDTTDIEVKRVVHEAGGQILWGNLHLAHVWVVDAETSLKANCVKGNAYRHVSRKSKRLKDTQIFNKQIEE